MQPSLEKDVKSARGSVFPWTRELRKILISSGKRKKSRQGAKSERALSPYLSPAGRKQGKKEAERREGDLFELPLTAFQGNAGNSSSDS